MKEKVSKDLLKGEEKANEIKRLESKIIKLDEKMDICYSEISWHCEHGTSEYHDREIMIALRYTINWKELNFNVKKNSKN